MVKIPKDLKEAKIRENTYGDSEKTAVTFNEVAESSKKLATALGKQHIKAAEASNKLAAAVAKQHHATKIQIENMYPHVSAAIKAAQLVKPALIDLAGVADHPKLTIPTYSKAGELTPIVTDIDTTNLEQLAVLEAQLKIQEETKLSIDTIKDETRVTGLLTKIIMVLSLISSVAAIAVLSRMIG